MLSSRQVGGDAEEDAARFLRKKGYQILARNFTIRGGEIDLVAKDNETLVFVEVKMRVGSKFGLAIESITPWKIKALKKTALFYIQNINWGFKPYRFDLVTIDYNDEAPQIEVIQNIIE